MAKKKDDWTETWWGGWLIAGGLFGGAFFIAWLTKAENPLSPIISIIGVVGVVMGGYFLYKLLKERSTEHTQNKNKIKYISIAISVCAIMAIVGMCSMTMELPSFSEREKVIKNISLNGADENSIPLAVSDLKLLKKGNDYTVICNLKKNSTEPTEGFFDFSIALVDKNGKYIKKENINSIDNDLPQFTYGSTYHLEKRIYISKDENKPVVIEFTDIKEYDKTTFTQSALNKAREHLNDEYTSSAKEYINKVLEYEPDNAEAKALLEQLSDPNHTPTPSASAETPQPEKNVLIGTGKENVRRLLSQYKETKSIMSNNALDFEDNNLLITVYFNSDDIADGVLFMQNSFDDVDTLTGVGSYVSKHYDELVNLATDDPNTKVESDLTLNNSQGVKKEAMELYIGNVPNGNSKSTTSNNNTDSGTGYRLNPLTGQWEKTSYSSHTETKSDNAEIKKKSEFSQCLSSGIVAGVKLYATPNNDSYVGTITSFSNDILDERGKKTKAVYISGGKADGWYKRSEIGQLYVRNDDPCLPSGRYVAESMGVD